MNRAALGLLLIVVLLSACSLGPSTLSDEQARATSKAFVSTSSALTMAVLPTLTNPPTNTALPTQPATATATQTATQPVAPSETATLPVVGTTPFTGTPPTPTVTATGTPPTPTSTVTGTPASPTASAVTGTPPSPTATDPMVTRVYGTQPPYVDYGRLTLINQSKTDVYISFQCTTPEGYHVIEEYPVVGTIKVSVAAGRCEYVAWIGGKQFTGEFGLKRFEELTFTFKKTGITIQ